MSTDTSSAQARFGTFGGVFTPCTLTILGVIMFMRAGYVVGDVGLWGALAILAIAKMITLLTTLSLSAIATNTEIRTGGVYYMISRTLGPDFGGAIGLTLFVSQAVSIAFYVIGFSEAMFGLFEPYPWLETYRVPQLVSSITVVLLFLVTFKGADAALKAQYFILAALLASVATFVVGGLNGFDSANFEQNLTMREGGAGFWIAFAIFFPAATGITAGANMSGDLKDPGKSIPNGTLASIGFTAVIYCLQLVLLAGFTDQLFLAEKPFEALKDMSVFAPLIVVGVFAATLSSALGSFLGAPRILQAMGNDGILKPLIFFGKGHGPENEPRRATVLSLGIALCVVWAGGLDAVAQVISMFFLIAYGMINLSAFVEGRGGNPSFRPRFKLFGWPAALVGSIGCAIAMFKIDETYAIVSTIIAGGIYFWLRGRADASWGDAKRGYIFARARQNLLLLEKSPADKKNWRPSMMMLTDDIERDRQMISCASWLENKRGILSIVETHCAPELDTRGRLEMRDERIREIREQLKRKQISAFADSIVVADDQFELDAILQSYSIGSLRPNTIMLALPPPDDEQGRKKMAEQLRTIGPFNRNIIIYKGAMVGDVGHGRIDLWWHGERNGSLMATYAYLVTQNPSWSKARIRMLRVVKSADEHIVAEKNLTDLMEAARMSMDIEVVLSDRPIFDLIVERSRSSDLVLMGIAEKDIYDMESLVEQRDKMFAELPPTLLVWSNGEVDVLA